MPAKILGFDPAEGNVALKLDSGEFVLLCGGFVDKHIFLCHALKKNILGMPIKKIWHFYAHDLDGKYMNEDSWSLKVCDGVDRLGEKNNVCFRFSAHIPLGVLLGYALQFKSLAAMQQAQDHHADLIDPEKAINAAISTGLLKKDWYEQRSK